MKHDPLDCLAIEGFFGERLIWLVAGRLSFAHFEVILKIIVTFEDRRQVVFIVKALLGWEHSVLHLGDLMVGLRFSRNQFSIHTFRDICDSFLNFLKDLIFSLSLQLLVPDLLILKALNVVVHLFQGLF